MGVGPNPCPVCGAQISGDYDLDERHQRLFGLHLQACAMEVEKLRVDYLSNVARDVHEIKRLVASEYRLGR